MSISVENALKIADSPSVFGLLDIRASAEVLAAEVRRLRQEVDDRRNYMNKIWHHIGDFPLWDGDEIVYMKGSGVIT